MKLLDSEYLYDAKSKGNQILVTSFLWSSKIFLYLKSDLKDESNKLIEAINFMIFLEEN